MYNSCKYQSILSFNLQIGHIPLPLFNHWFAQLQ